MDNSTLETILTVLAGGMGDIREELNKLNRTLERWQTIFEENPESIKEANLRMKEYFNNTKKKESVL